MNTEVSSGRRVKYVNYESEWGNALKMINKVGVVVNEVLNNEGEIEILFDGDTTTKFVLPTSVKDMS